jgi:hypothetical protein
VVREPKSGGDAKAEVIAIGGLFSLQLGKLSEQDFRTSQGFLKTLLLNKGSNCGHRGSHAIRRLGHGRFRKQFQNAPRFSGRQEQLAAVLDGANKVEGGGRLAPPKDLLKRRCSLKNPRHVQRTLLLIAHARQKET